MKVKLITNLPHRRNKLVILPFAGRIQFDVNGVCEIEDENVNIEELISVKDIGLSRFDGNLVKLKEGKKSKREGREYLNFPKEKLFAFIEKQKIEISSYKAEISELKQIIAEMDKKSFEERTSTKKTGKAVQKPVKENNSDSKEFAVEIVEEKVKEDPEKLEPTSAQNKSSLTKESLLGLKKSELVNLVEDFGFPKEEWESLNKSPLVDYILEQTK